MYLFMSIAVSCSDRLWDYHLVKELRSISSFPSPQTLSDTQDVDPECWESHRMWDYWMSTSLDTSCSVYGKHRAKRGNSGRRLPAWFSTGCLPQDKWLGFFSKYVSWKRKMRSGELLCMKRECWVPSHLSKMCPLRLGPQSKNLV